MRSIFEERTSPNAVLASVNGVPTLNWLLWFAELRVIPNGIPHFPTLSEATQYATIPTQSGERVQDPSRCSLPSAWHRVSNRGLLKCHDESSVAELRPEGSGQIDADGFELLPRLKLVLSPGFQKSFLAAVSGLALFVQVSKSALLPLQSHRGGRWALHRPPACLLVLYSESCGWNPGH